MKIVAISDIHNFFGGLNIPPADVLIIAGDLTNFGRIEELVAFNNDLEKIKNNYKHIIYIAGNHEVLHEQQSSLAQSCITHAHYLRDSGITIKDDNGKEFKLWGSPWNIEFGSWGFNLPRGPAMKEKWDLIPNDIDILITHQPPYGILDQAGPYSGHVGCPDLLDAILRIKPKVHIFGHIHWSHGIKDFNGTTFINASICGAAKAMGLPVNKPIEIEV